MSKFLISESEKQRILEMHQNATSRQYLMEDADSRITTLFNNIVTQVNSKIAEINKSKGSKIPNVSFKEVAADDPNLVNYNFYMGQSDLGQVPQKYLVINAGQNWSAFENKIYNLFKYSTNTSLSNVLKANGLGNNMSEFSNAATGVVSKILQGFQWDGKPTQK